MPWLGARPHKLLEALGVREQRQACPGNPLLYLCSLYNFVADINTHHCTNVEEFDYTLAACQSLGRTAAAMAATDSMPSPATALQVWGNSLIINETRLMILDRLNKGVKDI